MYVSNEMKYQDIQLTKTRGTRSRIDEKSKITVLNSKKKKKKQKNIKFSHKISSKIIQKKITYYNIIIILTFLS